MNSFQDPRSLDPAMSYIYGDTEQYLSTTSSESQSPLSSSFDIQLYIPDFSAADVYPSPDRDPASPDTPTEARTKTPAKRKRENRYKNAPPSVLSRRRAQNRASQRAYRERKDQRIKDLEQMLGDAKQRNETLTQAYSQLQAEYTKLKATQYQDQAYAEVPFDPTAAATVGLDLDLFTYPNMTAANYQQL